LSEDLSFADLGTSRAVVAALAEQGITAPFAIQQKVVADVLAGRDVLARSPTGSGKTLAFGIPIVDRLKAEGRRPAALILAPTRELATQIVDELRSIAHSRALRITAVYGGVGLAKQGKDAAQSHIIVATPGRLEDQLKRGAFTLDHVRMLVLDEADRMLDMGFKPAVDRIVALCKREDRQTLFFSATLDGDAGRAARAYTHNAAEHSHGAEQRRANDQIEHRFIETTHDHRVGALVEQLSASDRELTLVFVRTKRGADRLVKRLTANGSNAVAMHGNKSQRQRESALSRFQSGAVDTLVATDVAARGIDVKGVTHVINFDPPDDRDAYVHRVGRTARAGRTGVAITLVDRHQEAEIASLADALELQHELKGSKHNGDGRGHGGARQGRPSSGTAGRHGHDGSRSGPRPPRKPRHATTETNQRRRASRQGSRRAGTQPTG
jgi:ATP-dependent RNA helicase RhlE